MDLCDWVDVNGNRNGWPVAVDRHTDYTVVAPLPSPMSQAGAEKWRTERFCHIRWRLSVVSYEIVHALNQRAGGRESSGNTSVWSENEGLWRTGGTQGSHFPFERGRRKRPAGQTFDHLGISVRGLGKICRLGSDQQNRYMESAALAYLCAAEHLRGVASEEGDRLDTNGSRQVDELQNYEDLTLRSRLPSSVEVGQCSRIGEDQCSDSVTDNGEHFPSNCVIKGMVSESQECVRVVCRSMRKILEKLKSLCCLSRLYVVSGERAGETASLTPDQGRVH